MMNKVYVVIEYDSDSEYINIVGIYSSKKNAICAVMGQIDFNDLDEEWLLDNEWTDIASYKNNLIALLNDGCKLLRTHVFNYIIEEKILQD
jgi:hypothetical protein